MYMYMYMYTVAHVHVQYTCEGKARTLSRAAVPLPVYSCSVKPARANTQRLLKGLRNALQQQTATTGDATAELHCVCEVQIFYQAELREAADNERVPCAHVPYYLRAVEI